MLLIVVIDFFFYANSKQNAVQLTEIQNQHYDCMILE